jgi:hypothetical protein
VGAWSAQGKLVVLKCVCGGGEGGSRLSGIRTRKQTG